MQRDVGWRINSVKEESDQEAMEAKSPELLLLLNQATCAHKKNKKRQVRRKGRDKRCVHV